MGVVGMHVSLPEELENMVKDRVESGVYGSASEVVRAALRKFFHVSEEDNIYAEEAAHIREVIGLRLAALNDGSAELQDFDEAMNDIEQELFD
jgi:antitoxin ParD1/3/4